MRRGANYCHFTNNRLCFRLGLGHRESPSKRVVYFELSHNFCCVFVVSTARIIRLKHDSIGKLNLNFVLKVPLIMQN